MVGQSQGNGKNGKKSKADVGGCSVFDKSVKKYTVEFDSPVEHTLTFTPKVKQCILAFTLYTDATSSIAGITVGETFSTQRASPQGAPKLW